MADYGCRNYFIVLYVEKDGKVLMLHRKRRKHFSGYNGWWMLVMGNKRDRCIPPWDAARILEEETGLEAVKLKYRGLMQLWPTPWTVDGILLFEVMKWQGELKPDTYYGTYEWVDKNKVYGHMYKKLWRPDRTLLKLVRDKFKRLAHLRFSVYPDDTVYRGEWFWEMMDEEMLKEWDV